MAVLDRVDVTSMSPGRLRALFEEAVNASDRGPLDALLVALIDRATDAVAEHALDAIIEQRAQLARLREVADRVDGSIANVAREQLAVISHQLDRGRTIARLELTARRREGDYQGVRDRVLSLLRDRPRRPRDLAAELGCDPSQVVRALRELEDRGVRRVPAPVDATDKRAVYYAVVDQAAAAA